MVIITNEATDRIALETALRDKPDPIKSGIDSKAGRIYFKCYRRKNGFEVA